MGAGIFVRFFFCFDFVFQWVCAVREDSYFVFFFFSFLLWLYTIPLNFYPRNTIDTVHGILVIPDSPAHAYSYFSLAVCLSTATHGEFKHQIPDTGYRDIVMEHGARSTQGANTRPRLNVRN